MIYCKKDNKGYIYYINIYEGVNITIICYSQDVNRFFKGFCSEINMKMLISSESDVDHRNQQGLVLQRERGSRKI